MNFRRHSRKTTSTSLITCDDLYNRLITGDHLPKLIAFDLDLTLWHPPHELGLPSQELLKASSFGSSSNFYLFRDVVSILTAIWWYNKNKPATSHAIKVALISNTNLSEDNVKTVIYNLAKNFPGRNAFTEIQNDPKRTSIIHYVKPRAGGGLSKIERLKDLSRESNISFQNMLYFDDLEENIKEIRKLGIFSILVDETISDKLEALYAKDTTYEEFEEFEKDNVRKGLTGELFIQGLEKVWRAHARNKKASGSKGRG